VRVDDLSVALEHLSYSLGSLRDLPPYAAYDDPRCGEVQPWCLEAFYMHARVAADFFVKMPRRDYTARSFVRGWALADTGARAVLDHAWLVASQQVAHLSRARVMHEGDEPEPTGLADLQQTTAAADAAARQFVAEYRQQHPESLVSVETLLLPLPGQ
jgi:hypothetical protein